MTLTFHALWMLCVLGAVVFAASAAWHVRGLTAVAVGLATGVAWASPARLPDAAVLGLLAVLAAVTYVFRPRWRLVSEVSGGLLAGVATALLEVQGVPAVVSPVLGLGLIVVPVWLTRTRPEFAPETLRDESMLAIGVIGLAVAALPGVLDGWQAATTLAAASDRTVAAAVPMWTAAVLIASSSLGALYSLWSRR